MTRESEPATSFTGPLIAWLAVQLLALGLGAAGLPLSAKSVRPPEAMSVQILLVTQVVAAAALWPMLFGSGRQAGVTIATAVPFTQAAGFLSATPPGDLLSAGGMLLLWLGSLAVLPARDLGETGRLVVRATAVVLSAGLAVAGYLRMEFAPPQTPTPGLGPVAWALGNLSPAPHALPWVWASGLFAVCLIARVAVYRVRHTSPPQASRGGGAQV
jgi:hypothetical protein